MTRKAPDNRKIAEVFERLANLLEIDGANPFRVRAYREAARIASSQPSSLAERFSRGEDLTEIPGIGKDLAERIGELARTGTLGALREIERKVPRALGQLLQIPGLGPKRVRALHDRLGVRSRRDLERVLKTGKLRKLRGFGELTERAISEALSGGERKKARVPIDVALEASERLIARLKALPGVDQAIAAGSLRRRLETVGDVDILVSLAKGARAQDGASAVRAFVESEGVTRVVARGTTRAAVQLDAPGGRSLRVDLRVVPRESFGAALYYFTGSKAHNIHVRALAQKLDLKINEYGVFKGARRVAGETEESVFRCVGLPYIEPEMREDRGEIEAASFGELPQLVQRSDARGELSPGSFEDLEERARRARDAGLEYVAVQVAYSGMPILSKKAWSKRLREIDAIDRRIRKVRIVRLADAVIHEDGSLGLPDWMIEGEGIDGIVGRIESAAGLSREAQTERLLRALEHPVLSALGPSSQLGGPGAPDFAERVDLPRLLKALHERGRALDIKLIDPRLSKGAHVRTMIRGDLDRGIDRARRGWLEPWDVVNTRRTAQLLKILRRK